MASTYIYDYVKFRPHFDTLADLTADTSLAYAATGNKYRVDVGDYVTAGTADYVVISSGGSGDVATAGGVQLDKVGASIDREFVVAVTDETTAISAATGKITFRMPHAMTLTSVRASVVSACTTGTFTVDINESGTTILSTKLTLDAGEKTSTTAATAAVISDSALADDAEITIDVDDAGDGTATGLKVTFIGTLA